MKLSVKLDALWASVQQMGAEHTDFDLGEVWDDSVTEFDKELSSSGVEISLEDLVPEQGLLSVKGRQVLLFIPDHSYRIEDVLADPGSGNKFHIADCRKLHEMRQRKRFDRYKVTNNLSGDFNIYGSVQSGKAVEGIARLNVCKLCLSHLNYKGAANAGGAGRSRLVESFDIGDFFSTYSSLFKHLPKGISHTGTGYTDDWKDVSYKVRKTAGFTCQKCSLDLSEHKKLLHVHHLNGVKHDNSDANLMVLCLDCHRKEPHHDHMFIRHEETQLLNRLRREQQLILSGLQDWEQAIKYADTAVHGILDHARHRNYSPPEVGYELTNDKGRVVAELELAWPDTRFGIYIDEPVEVDGWYLQSIEQAMEFFSKKR
ncbi:HNH endonuclease [Spongorhabdus nitratireducens]